MRKLFICAIILFLPGILSADTGKWRESRSTHFIVYYQNAPVDFIDRLKEKAEDYYNQIAEDLGFRRYDFWVWEKRAKIYIYDTPEDFRSATKQQGWAVAAVRSREKIIYSFVGQQGFVETALPHELGHIIFGEFVGFDNPGIPAWFNEGVACYQEKIRRKIVNKILHQMKKESKFIALTQLATMNPQLIADPQLAGMFYNESLGVVYYLIDKFGEDNFVYFCQHLRDKKDFEQALRRAYPFSNLKELDEAWQEYLSYD